MGCGCKENKIPNDLKKYREGKENGLNLKGKFLKLLAVIGVTVVIFIASPFLILGVWFIAIKSAIGDEVNLVNFLLYYFNKKDDETDINMEDDLVDSSDLELHEG